MRLIDADVADKWMRQNNAFIDAAILKAIPTIDAVPVVRCRECKHYKDLGTYYRLMDCTHRDGLTNPYEDDFCSYGERKDEVNES